MIKIHLKTKQEAVESVKSLKKWKNATEVKMKPGIKTKQDKGRQRKKKEPINTY